LNKKEPLLGSLKGLGEGEGIDNRREGLSEPLRRSERYFFVTPKISRTRYSTPERAGNQHAAYHGGLPEAAVRLQEAVVKGIRIVAQEYNLRLDKNDPVEESGSGQILIVTSALPFT